jgi:hypothetical protein
LGQFENVADFQVTLKQSYATEVTYNCTCLYAKIRLCQFPQLLQFKPCGKCVGHGGHLPFLVTSFDIMYFAFHPFSL